MPNQRLPTEPKPQQQASTRRGSPSHKGEKTLMENTQEDLKAHLMQTDEGFRRLAEQHTKYHQQLEALEAKTYLTPQYALEEHKLKMMKLHFKDQMKQWLSLYQPQHFAYSGAPRLN